MTSFRRTTYPVLILTFSLGSVASAHDLPKDAAPDAETFITRGLDLREKGEDEAALHNFRHANDLDRGPRSLAQIALAEQALGRWVDAEMHLTEALRQTTHPWIAANGVTLGKALEEIRGRLGSLDLREGVPGAEVRVNGQLAGLLPLRAPLRVVAGSVALEVNAPGYLSLQRSILVPANGLARENLLLVKMSDTISAQGTLEPPRTGTSDLTAGMAPPPARDSHERWSWQKRAGLGGLATGALSLVIGIVYQVKRERSVSAFSEAGCGRIDPPCPDRLDTINSQRNMMVGGYVGAALLGGAGAALLLTAPDRPGKGDGPTGESRRAVSALACGPGSAGLGLACAGRF